ncbi:30S ribosomal protein S14 [Candidatus Brocadia pituitae]|nr:type Z 30S ribosomal protein S14 [Candidatus Brocadia sp.]MDG6027170.1 type Z 30S ribosomal protein S14 [Candidatus Brocadia sp.]BBO18164.1 30S ribosomal protein S14 [Candidatus Brocadia pituitae]
MARKCLIEKSKKESKYKSRQYNRCKLCGRRRAYFRRFQICRLCFRKLASKGEIPGVKKASW